MQTATGVFYLRCRGIKGRKKGGTNNEHRARTKTLVPLAAAFRDLSGAVRSPHRRPRPLPSVRLSFLKRGHAPVICDVVEAGASERDLVL